MEKQREGNGRMDRLDHAPTYLPHPTYLTTYLTLPTTYPHHHEITAFTLFLDLFLHPIFHGSSHLAPRIAWTDLASARCLLASWLQR